MYLLGEPLDSLVLKVERAKKHILQLEAEYASFRKDRPYRVDFKVDPGGWHTLHRLLAVDYLFRVPHPSPPEGCGL